MFSLSLFDVPDDIIGVLLNPEQISNHFLMKSESTDSYLSENLIFPKIVFFKKNYF